MWPFSEMSLSSATLIGSIANWALLISLIGGVVSTFVIVKTSNVKEEHWAEDRLRSNERITELNNETERLKAENLKFQLAVQPRRIVRYNREGDAEVRAARFAEVKKYRMTAYLQSVPDFEAQILESDIKTALRDSGWTAIDLFEPAVSPGLIMPGVRIVTLEDAPRLLDNPPRLEKAPETDTTRAARALWQLLMLDLGPPRGPLSGVMYGPEYRNDGFLLKNSTLNLGEGMILILVGTRPVPDVAAPLEAPPSIQTTK